MDKTFNMSLFNKLKMFCCGIERNRRNKTVLDVLLLENIFFYTLRKTALYFNCSSVCLSGEHFQDL